MPHVAFVALSGFRIADEGLRALGLRLPGLRRRGEAIAGLPPLGLLTLAALTPDDWSRSWREAAVVDDALVAALVAERPTLVALSALTASADEAYRLADALRAEGVAVALGGLHATACPDEVEARVGCAVVGDGEPVWSELLRDALAQASGTGALRPRYQAATPFDLAAAPVPAWELLAGRRPARFTLQTARGCPLACSFCGASRLLGRFREKPRAALEREVAAIASQARRPLIELADDNTFAGARDPRDVLEPLAAAGARWFTEADWRLGERPDLCAALAASGCVQVLVGVESLVQRHPGMGGKSAPPARVLAALEAIQAAGVAVNACFIVGADGETEPSVAALGELICDATLAEVQLTLQTPFPGTALRRDLERAGRLLPEATWAQHTLFDVTYRPDPLSPAALDAAFRALLAQVYGPGPTAARAATRRAIWRRAGLATRDLSLEDA